MRLPQRKFSIALVLLLMVGVTMPTTSVSAGLLLGAKDREKASVRKSVSRDIDGPWLMSYYVGYQNGYLKPRDVDYSLMTHIVVGGVGARADGTLNEHWHLSNGDGRDMAEEVGRRADRKGVKKLIWLGGPNEEDKFYSATSNTYREAFVENIIELVDELGYDGVDIDWEPIRSKDEDGILRLVRDLREADPDLIITVPVNWVETTMLARKDLSVYDDMAQYVDRMFIMSYSMAGPWPGWQSWHGGALKGDGLTTPGSVDTSVRAYTRAGVPEEKLGVGVGTYATCWEYPVRKPKQTLPYGFSSRDIGVMSMRTLMDDYYSRKYEEWDSRAKVPYLSYRRAHGDWECGFISYENERSVEEKMEYVRDGDLGGAIVWNIGTGYMPDASRSKRHPYLKAAWEALYE
jgi:chitinase